MNSKELNELLQKAIQTYKDALALEEDEKQRLDRATSLRKDAEEVVRQLHDAVVADSDRIRLQAALRLM